MKKVSKSKKKKIVKKLFDLHGRLEIRENMNTKLLNGTSKKLDVLTARYGLNMHLAETPFPRNKWSLFIYNSTATELGCSVCVPPDGAHTYKSKMKLWTIGIEWQGDNPSFHTIYPPDIKINYSYYVC